MSRETPWGPAQDARQIAPGIIVYSTAGHGGIHLSAERMAFLPGPIRAFRTWAGLGWFEEDCDASLVILSFPDLFPARQVASAVQQVRGRAASEEANGGDNKLGPISDWLHSPAGAHLIAIEVAWVEENRAMFRPSCSGSIPRRHEELARALMAKMPTYPRPRLGWALLRRVWDGAEAEALLTTDEEFAHGGLIDLSKIPAERILRQPA